MELNLINDLWSELKIFVPQTDRDDCADALVSMLIDDDFEAEDIRSAMGHDIHIKRALSSYLQTDDFDDEDPEDEFEDDKYLDDD